MQENALEVRIRAEGLAVLIGELRQEAKGWRHDRSAETRLDGSTVVVRIPMRFRRRGGRKRIVAPDGSEIVPTTKPQPDGTLVKALARAWRGSGCWRWRVRDARRAGGRRTDQPRYVSRVLRLTLLAPDVVERILDGRPTAGLAQFLQPFPVEWERQRDSLL